MDQITFSLTPVPPFRLDLTVWVLKRRPDYTVDQWDGRRYQRALVVDGHPLAVTVEQAGDAAAPRVDVTVVGESRLADQQGTIARTVTEMLGLEVGLSDFFALAARDPLLAPLATRFRGMKPTRYPSLFECLTNAITCQQVTLTFGLQVVGRLAARYGMPVEVGRETQHAFPSPDAIATAEPDDLRAIGYSRQKARALIELAQAITDGSVDLGRLATLDDASAIAELTALRGVGRWTAEYTLLRGLGRLNVFPGDDVGARNKLEKWLGADGRLDYAGVQAALTDWRRYGGLIYFHMLLLGLDERGVITAPDEESNVSRSCNK